MTPESIFKPTDLTCPCGGQVIVSGNWDEKKFSVFCSGCGLQTAEYASPTLAHKAWERGEYDE